MCPGYQLMAASPALVEVKPNNPFLAAIALSLSLSLSLTHFFFAPLVLLHLVFLNPNPTKLLPSPSLFPATAILATGIQNLGSCRKHHLDSLSSMSLSVYHQPMTLAQGV